MVRESPPRRGAAGIALAPIVLCALAAIASANDLQADGEPPAGPRVTLRLAPDTTCTDRPCPPDDPCCNVCQFVRWRVPGHDEVMVRAVAGELPTCAPDGCGDCRTHLDATGYADAGAFVVERFEPPFDLAEGERLRAFARCTARACPPEDLCCNSCGFAGWTLVDAPELEVRAAHGGMPACTVDGCGNCAFELMAAGARLDGTFVVESWWQVPIAHPGTP